MGSETANQIQPWTPSTTSLPALADRSRAILQCATSPHEAATLAKQLIGCWPHASPPDPKTYAASIAATLAGYPLGLVQECCDPRSGLARGREFPPTVAAIVAWCDNQLEFHQQLASWKPRPPQLPAPEYSDEHCAAMREKIAEIPKVYFRKMGDA